MPDNFQLKIPIIDHDISVTAELEKERLQNAELRKRIDDMPGHGGHNASEKPIPRPKGTAGTNFSIQEAMGLSGSSKKYETYKVIQVGVDVFGGAGHLHLVAQPTGLGHECSYQLGSSVGPGSSEG